MTRPNMKGSFSNTIILLLGAIIGLGVQLHFSRRKRMIVRQ